MAGREDRPLATTDLFRPLVRTQTDRPPTTAFDADEFGANLQRVERVIAAPEWESFRAIPERANVEPFARTVPDPGAV